MKAFVGAVASAAILVAGVAFALPRPQESKPAPGGTPGVAAAQTKDAVVIPFFGNEKCAMTGKPISKTKYVVSGNERAYFCCANCLGKAKADPKAAVAAAYKDAKPAGNKVCPVSNHGFEAGKGLEVTWQGHKISLCCAECEAPFKKDPMVYVAMAVYGAEDLGNKVCPVMKVNSGEDTESDSEYLAIYKGKIVRLCCGDCGPDFAKDPEKYMAKASGK